MIKVFLLILPVVFLLGIFAFTTNIYFPLDILHLLQPFHEFDSPIPHNSLISDPITQFEPWRFFSKRLIQSGEFPLWNSLNAGGVPLFANGQSAILFPLNFIYFLLPYQIALNLIPLLKMALLFFFTFLYLRQIKVSIGSSFTGSFIVVSLGFFITWLLWPHTNVFLLLPLFLFITEKIKANKEQSYGWLALLSISYCVAFFGGHVETLKDLMFVHFFYVVFREGLHLKRLLIIAVFILVGFLLAAIQFVPFFEYFINSYAQEYRTHSEYLFLPFISIIINIFPFIMGAPHLEYYRPISPLTNFQESIGGYTGLIVLITTFGFFSKLRKNSLLNFWLILGVFFALLAYKIWPIGLLLELPILSQAQNSRLIALFGFALSISFALIIDHSQFIQNIKKISRNYMLIVGVVIVSIIIMIYSLPNIIFKEQLSHPFIFYLQEHIGYILLTTYLYFFTLHFFVKRNNKIILSFISVVFISLQSLFLLANYVPLINEGSYYPSTSLIKKMQSLPEGRILEVGNPSIIPNINLMYGLFHVENYDGIEIKNYKEEMDKTFINRNHWGKVESFSHSDLKRFNISYILSDFNINFTKQIVQPNINEIIGPILGGAALHVSFSPQNTSLKEIRILTANYNRKNNCRLNISLKETKTKKEIYKSSVSCRAVLDKMFFTLKVEKELELEKIYTIEITSSNSSQDSSIGFWGADNKPYLELLYEIDSSNTYQKIYEENGIKLFKIPDIQPVITDAQYSILQNSNTAMLIRYSSDKDTTAEIKRTFYPGWSASIDGEKVDIADANPFIRVNVPKGEHIIRLSYTPISFYIGTIISICTLTFLTLFLARKQRRVVLSFVNKVSKRLRRTTNAGLKDYLLLTTTTIIIFIFLTLVQFIFPNNSDQEFTTVINWLNIHNHSLALDSLRFIYIIFSVVLSIFLSVTFFIWKKIN